MSSETLKDLSKSLGRALTSSTSDREYEAECACQAFLDRQPYISELESHRLHEELGVLYTRHVASDASKQAAFLKALQRLHPALCLAADILQWWPKLLEPSLVAVEIKRSVQSLAREIVIATLVYEREERSEAGETPVREREDRGEGDERIKASGQLTLWILDLYLDKTRLPDAEGEASDVQRWRAKHVAENLENVLVEFGRKCPRRLLNAIDSLLLRREYRLQALTLLSTVVRHEPPHLHQVRQTNLFDNLLKCLLIDTSTTAVSLALTSLVMLLPHLPNSLVPYLPQLFAIYTRILCWERFRPAVEDPEEASKNGPSSSSPIDPSWEKLTYSFDSAESTAPDLIHFFTFLYGFYPLNFMTFIRKPTKYLREANADASLDFDLDPAMIHARSQGFQTMHLLHSNFYNLTLESELTDMGRFTRNEPADIVAECMSLRLNFPADTSMRPDSPGQVTQSTTGAFVPTEDIPSEHLTNGDEADSLLSRKASQYATRPSSLWRYTQSTAVGSHSSLFMDEGGVNVPRRLSRQGLDIHMQLAEQNGSRSISPAIHSNAQESDSPTLPPHLVPGQQADGRLQEMLQTQETLRRSLDTNQSAGGVSGARLGPYIQSLGSDSGSGPRSPALRPAASGMQSSFSFLQREVILLKNELNFERYLKQQHLSHIGQLQRRRIAEAAVEAETLNLITTNRNLKNRLEDSRTSYATLKKEAAASKSHAMKWEHDLSSKHRALREEQKKWRETEDGLRRELHNIQQERDRLRGMAMESDSKDFFAHQKLKAVQSNSDELSRLRTEVERLNEEVEDKLELEASHEQAKRDEEAAHAEIQIFKMKLSSREAERDRMKRAYEQKVASLESQLRPASKQQQQQQQHSAPDPGLAAQYEQLRKVHNKVLDKYTNLQMKHADLQSVAEQHGLPTTSSSSGGGSPALHKHSQYTAPRPVSPPSPSAATFGSGNGIEGATLSPVQRRDSFRLSSSAPISTSLPAAPAHILSLQGYEFSTSPRGRYSNGPPLAPLQHFQSAPPDGRPASQDSTQGLDQPPSPTKSKIKANSEIRVYGRGGVQNIGKKDKKDKEREREREREGQKEKKQTKPVGLKGIRGFV